MSEVVRAGSSGDERRDALYARFAEHMADRRRAEVPLGEVLAIIGELAEPEISVAMTRAALDDLANRTAAATPEELMFELFGPGRLGGNAVSYDDPRNSFLYRVIERQLGIPISLSTVALEVAHRLGIALVGIGVPGHFIVAAPGSNGERTYFDPFHGGRRHDPASVRELYEGLTNLTNWRDDFLTPTPARHMVIRVLNNLKSIYVRRAEPSHVRWVMHLRSVIPEIGPSETQQFARLMRHSN
ncbi:MAG: transglutaminase family protein [Ilumatobacteraceae bacterium]